MNEPVLTAASIAGLISAVLLWVRIMGWITWTDDQFNQFMIVVNLALPIVGGIWARARVTPTADPKIVTDAGRKVELVRADGKALEAP